MNNEHCEAFYYEWPRNIIGDINHIFYCYNNEFIDSTKSKMIGNSNTLCFYGYVT